MSLMVFGPSISRSDKLSGLPALSVECSTIRVHFISSILVMSAIIVGPGPAPILAFWALILDRTLWWVISTISREDEWFKGNSALICIVSLVFISLNDMMFENHTRGFFNNGLPCPKGGKWSWALMRRFELGPCLFGRALHDSCSCHIILLLVMSVTIFTHVIGPGPTPVFPFGPYSCKEQCCVTSSISRDYAYLFKRGFSTHLYS